MAGLLDMFNSQDGQQWLGLLAAAGPRADNAGFGQRLQEGLAAGDNWKAKQQALEFQKMQMQNYASEIKQREAAMQQQAQKQAILQQVLGRSSQVSPGAMTPDVGGVGPTMPQSVFQQAQAGGRGGIGGMNVDDVALLKANGVADLFKEFEWANNPQKLEQGATYENRITGKREFMPKITDGIGPDGRGGYTDLNGYAQGIANIEGAKTAAQERAKAGLDFVTVPMGNGQTKMMPRSQAIDQLSGGSQLPGNGLDMSRVTPEQLKLMAQQDPQALQAGIQRFQGGAKQSDENLGVTQSPLDAGKVKNSIDAGGKINDTWLKTSYEPAIASGQSAQNLIDNTDIARTAIRKLGGTGWGTEAKATGANVLAGLGIAPENAKMFAANAQVFQSKAMDRLWTVLNDAKGPQTEGDATRASQTWASLKNTPEANEYIMDIAQAKAERDKARATFFKNALPIAQKNGDLSEVDREWDKRMPSIFDMPSMKRWAK